VFSGASWRAVLSQQKGDGDELPIAGDQENYNQLEEMNLWRKKRMI
jgi:hypothetical protein